MKSRSRLTSRCELGLRSLYSKMAGNGRTARGRGLDALRVSTVFSHTTGQGQWLVRGGWLVINSSLL